MIKLHPKPDIKYTCAKCGASNKPHDWFIPGMRNLAMVSCQSCGIQYYADLPSGHGLTYPMYLFPETGEIDDPRNIDWFSEWLRESYLNRNSKPIGFKAIETRQVRKPILLNCLDKLYGHSLYKLLNAQYYLDHYPDYDLIVLIQPFLNWLVPEQTAQIWIVDLPLREGADWNEWLASEIKHRISQYSECMLSLAVPCPHPEEVSIGRFVKIPPMDIRSWENSISSPVVTFVWRDDRLWSNHNLMSFFQKRSIATTEQQKKNVVELSKLIRKEFPTTDFAVAGLSRSESFPDPIANLTFDSMNDSVEMKLCERYAKSHIIIGVHGSNMILPSALAGTVIELIGTDRNANLVQDLWINEVDPRSTLVRYRFLPLTASPEEINLLACSILRMLPKMLLNFERPWVDHKKIQSDPDFVARRSLKLYGRNEEPAE